MLVCGVEIGCQIAKRTALSRVGDGGRDVGFDSAQLPMHTSLGPGMQCMRGCSNELLAVEVVCDSKMCKHDLAHVRHWPHVHAQNKM